MIKCSGLSLLEVMVGLMVSSVLMTVLCDVVYVAYGLSVKQQTLATVHDDAVSMVQILSQDIAYAGYLPCRSAWHRDSRQNADPFFTKDQLMSFQGGQLSVHYMSVDALPTTREGSDVFVVSKHQGIIDVGDQVVIASCHHAVVRDVVSVYRGRQQIRYRVRFPVVFDSNDTPVFIGKRIAHSYAVKPTRRRDPMGRRIYALYQKNETGRFQELIEHVRQLSITIKESGLVTIHFKIEILGQSYSYVFTAKAYNV